MWKDWNYLLFRKQVEFQCGVSIGEYSSTSAFAPKAISRYCLSENLLSCSARSKWLLCFRFLNFLLIEEKTNDSFPPLSLEGLMALLREIGIAYQYLSQYNCRKAIECLEALPPQHFNTGWVLSMMGKAYFELSDFQTSIRFVFLLRTITQCGVWNLIMNSFSFLSWRVICWYEPIFHYRYFREVRVREPHRTQMMEIMSTALWHLQCEVELSALAQELVEQDRMSPAAWCAAGNCFSLQKEHDAAIKFFQRAVQVDPSFAYAYTLLGHEYVTTEELDRAMSAFRSAIRLDSRHYNAWYGIGSIYSKEEQYQLAEFHFKKALAIHPQSSILMCHIGVVSFISVSALSLANIWNNNTYLEMFLRQQILDKFTHGISCCKCLRL